MAKVGLLFLVLLLGLSVLPPIVTAQSKFDAIRTQVRTEVQERQRQPHPTPQLPVSTATPAGFLKWWPTAENAQDQAPVVKTQVIYHWAGDWVVLRRVEGQLYLSIGAQL